MSVHPDIQSAGSHIHEMVDLCISGSVVCIITRNTCIMDARCCIGVVQYIGAHAVPRYTQLHTNDTSNTSALIGADRDVGYHMSRIMDQGSRGSGVSCPETVSRIAHIVSTHRMACRAHASIASLYAPAMALHCHATMQSMGNISNTLILRNHGSWDGYPDDHISAMSCLACHDHECTSLIACVAIACLEPACTTRMLHALHRMHSP